MIANIAERPCSDQPSVASVAHSVSGTSTVSLPSWIGAARLRTSAVGASSPACLVRRRTRLREL